MWHLDIFDAQILAQNVIEGANSFPLLAVPFFMLAGEIMNAGGLSRRIVNFAMSLVGHIKGGLGYVAILSACIMAALSGSAVADAAALSALLLPMMVAAGHDKARSAGLLASASIIAPIIPPALLLRDLWRGRQRVDFQIVHGRHRSRPMLGASLWFTWGFLARREQVAVPVRKTAAEVAAAFKDATFALVTPIIVIVGLKFGVFTPTEAAVVAAVYALFVSTVIYGELKSSQLYGLFLAAAKTTAVIMFLVAAAMVSAWLITVAQLPAQPAALASAFAGQPPAADGGHYGAGDHCGRAMDMTPTILILTPVLMPLVKAAGIDPVYFGVLFVMNNAIGLITPPVGTVLNTVAGVGKVSMDDVTRGVWPFMVAQFTLMFLMVLFPQIVMVPARWFY